MDINKLRKQLEIDEGCSPTIYNDHLGNPTFGIGHLIIKTDPEYGKPVGTGVTQKRLIDVFEIDVNSVIHDCHMLYSYFFDLPEEAQQVIANMMFNMGRTRLSKFKKMKSAIDVGKWIIASIEMQDSNWYRQVPNRAGRLVDRMRAIGE
jgi:lysozyme